MSIKDGNCHHCGDLVQVAEHICRKIDPDSYTKIVRVGLDAQREFIKDMSDDTIATLVSVTGRFGGGTSSQIDRMLARELADRFKGHIGTFERDSENGYMSVLQHGAFSVSTIAQRLNISLSTASRGLAKLQKKGLVVAEDDEDDGRKRIYALVETGK